MSIAQVVGRFYFLFFTFLPAQKSNKKRPPKSNTARFRETALRNFCSLVAWALVMLRLGGIFCIFVDALC